MFNPKKVKLNSEYARASEMSIFNIIKLFAENYTEQHKAVCVCCGEKEIPYVERHGYPVCEKCAMDTSLTPFKCDVCEKPLTVRESRAFGTACICNECVNATKDARDTNRRNSKLASISIVNIEGVDRRRLYGNNISTIGDIVKMSQAQFRSLPGIGKKTCEKVANYLESIGVTWE